MWTKTGDPNGGSVKLEDLNMDRGWCFIYRYTTETLTERYENMRERCIH